MEREELQQIINTQKATLDAIKIAKLNEDLSLSELVKMYDCLLTNLCSLNEAILDYYDTTLLNKN